MRNILKLGSILLAAIIFIPGSYLKADITLQQLGIASLPISSPNPVGSGARALGMGGAFIAIADDATAASWNPAGLIQLERLEFSIVGAYFSRQDEFSSNLNPKIANTGRVDESNINYISATIPFRLFHRNMVASVNYQRLFEFKKNFDYQHDFSPSGIDFPHYRNFRQDGYIGALGLASAIQITPYFSFGATLNIWTDKLFWRNTWNDAFSLHGVGTVGGLPATIDANITNKFSSFRGINFNFGFLYEITQYLTLGAVVKTPFEADLRHEFRFNSSITVDTITIINKKSRLEDIALDMPFAFGMGLALRISDTLSFSLDIYRTEWSDYILTVWQGKKVSPIDFQPGGSSDLKDTTQIRLGGEYLFIGRDIVIPLRGGFFYDPEPSLGALKDFYGFSIGTGLVHKRTCFDAAYQFRWAQDIDTGNFIAGSRGETNHHLVLTSFIIHL